MRCPNCGGTEFRTLERAYATGYASTDKGWFELFDTKDHDYETEMIRCSAHDCEWEHTLADGEAPDDVLTGGGSPATIRLQETDRNPAHVRVKVWAGRNPGARGLSGELVFRTDEWDELREWIEIAPQVGVTTRGPHGEAVDRIEVAPDPQEDTP